MHTNNLAPPLSQDIGQFDVRFIIHTDCYSAVAVNSIMDDTALEWLLPSLEAAEIRTDSHSHLKVL